jgi:hypothetical protein
MKAIQVVGLAFWRGGVILVVGYLAYQALRAILTFTDPQLELAVGVFLTGVVLVFISVVAEQIQAGRAERSNHQ